MDLRKLKTLIDLVAESGIAELEVTEGDGKVRIVRSQAPSMHYPPVGYPGMLQAPQPAPGPATSAGGAPTSVPNDAPGVASGPAAHERVVTSPMVGTFYRSPAPDKPPFVEIGHTVKASDHVCIIEAMKLLNEIEAGFDGTIQQILVENGQPVEFGQPMFIIA